MRSRRVVRPNRQTRPAPRPIRTDSYLVDHSLDRDGDPVGSFVEFMSAVERRTAEIVRTIADGIYPDPRTHRTGCFCSRCQESDYLGDWAAKH